MGRRERKTHSGTGRPLVCAVLDQPARRGCPPTAPRRAAGRTSATRAQRADAAGDRTTSPDGATGERSADEHLITNLRRALRRTGADAARCRGAAYCPTDTGRRWLMLTRFVRNQL